MALGPEQVQLDYQSRRSADLGPLVRFGLLRRAPTVSEANYLFKHGLVLETAYRSLLRQERGALHKKVGEVLAEQKEGRETNGWIGGPQRLLGAPIRPPLGLVPRVFRDQ